MNAQIGIRIGIATAVIAIAMLGMVSGAAAYAVPTVGTIQFENGTTCPYGWTICEENLNESYPECLEASGEPWCEPTYECPPFWNYLVTGGACAGPDVVYFKLTATSPDGKWYGEKIIRLEDAYEADHPGCGFYEVNLVVHEVELPKILIEDAEDGDIHDDWVWYPGWEPIDQYSNWFEISTYNVNSTYSLCLDDVWRTWFPACVDKDIEDVSADQFGLLEFDVYGYNGSAGSSDAMLVGLVATDGVTTWFGHANPGTINSSLNQDYNAVDLVRTPTKTWKHFILDFANAEKTPMAGKTIDKVRLYLYTGGGQGHWTCFYIDNMYLVDPPVLPDVIPPGADITTPDDGENVEGVVPIDIAAQDNAAISWYSIEIDDTVVLEKKPTEAEPSITDSYDWDTSAYADGEHTLAVIVSDTSENIGTDEITVYNGGELKPDLIVEDVELNPDGKHYYFANESNVVNVTVKNIGAGAAGASHVKLSGASGDSASVAVGALAADASEEVSITDTTPRPAGELVIAIADCDGEVTESNETNNDSAAETVTNHGLKGKTYTGGENITTKMTYDLNGNLVYSVGDSYYASGYDYWTHYTVNWTAAELPIPGTATVEEARLYAIYTWDKHNVMPDNVSMSFNGVSQEPEDQHYWDKKGWGSASYDLPYGMLAYDVTSDFDPSGNSADLTKTESSTQVSMRGMLLVVVYEDANEPQRLIFVNEEFDNLYGADSYCTTPEEATAWAPITGPVIDRSKVENATLIAVAPGAGSHDGSYTPVEGELLFNGNVWTDAWDFVGTNPDEPEIGIREVDVKPYLDATDNEAGFQSSSDWMEASNAFLVVEYKKELIVSYGDSVHFKRNVRVPWRALDEPDRQGAVMFRNAKIAIELEDTIPDCEKVSVWVRRLGFRVPTFEVGVSSDGSTWTTIGTETCSSIGWTRYDFTGDWDNVKYIGIRKPGSPWRPKLMGLDAVYAEGWN